VFLDFAFLEDNSCAKIQNEQLTEKLNKSARRKTAN